MTGTKINPLTHNQDEIQHVPITTATCGVFNCYIQGDMHDRHLKTIFMTVHDMGTNHRSMINFVNTPEMADVKAKSIFMHVCVPGQDEHAQDWLSMHPTLTYPTLDEIGNALAELLDHMGFKSCIAIGEGAGANIVCRFAMTHPNKVNGLCLIHCTATSAGVVEYLRDKYVNMKLHAGKMDSAAYTYLLNHKFGNQVDETSANVKEYMEEMMNVLTPANLSLYLQSFMKRTDLSTKLPVELSKMDVLLVVGSEASYVHTVHTMHQSMNRERTTLLLVDGVGDVMSEAPDKLTRALILFCKGCGVLSGVDMPGMVFQRTLSSSMEDADKPRKLSATMTK